MMNFNKQVLGLKEALAIAVFQRRFDLKDDNKARDLWFHLDEEVSMEYITTVGFVLDALKEMNVASQEKDATPAKAPPAKPAKQAKVITRELPKAWSQEEVEKLTDIITAGNYTYTDVAQKMNRSIGSVSAAISALKRGLPVGNPRVTPKQSVKFAPPPNKKAPNHWRHYTKEEVETVKELIEKGWSNKEIARKTGRKPHAISVARWKLKYNQPIGPQQDKNP